MKVTTLCENSAAFPSQGLLGEHGLSMLLETGGKKILFDTGGGLTLLHNARTLNIDLTQIDAVVLSHAHYDHTGGLKQLLQLTGPVPVYAHPEVFNGKYHLRKDQEPKLIGVPWPREELEALGADFHLGSNPLEIAEGVTITGEIPRTEAWEKDKDWDLVYKNADGTFSEDPLNDDQSIIVESAAGTVVMLGCAHAGVVNILQYVRKLTGKSEIYACFGGMHLINASPERLQKTAEMLKGFALQKIAACHCTGFRASCFLLQAFREQFFVQTTGTIFQEN